MNFTLFNTMVLIAVILIVWVPWLLRYKIKPYFANKALQEKLKNNPHWKELYSATSFLCDLYKGIHTSAISKQERKRLEIEDDAFIYGEVEFLPFFSILEKVKPKQHDIFCDLGSGAGKAVFVAATFFKLSKAYGVEMLPALHDLAINQIQKAKHLANVNGINLSSIEFIQEDYLKFDFSNADIIFINATCISFPMWEKILEKLARLKLGSRVIVTSKKIPHSSFEVISQSIELMSWGMNSVNIYHKVA